MALIIDHIDLKVSDLDEAKAFYRQALAPLKIDVVMELSAQVTGTTDVVGFGRDGKPEFWLEQGRKTEPRLHIAFAADNRKVVRRFHAAALAAGGRDNGAPGLRPHYHPDYYAAFVLDPDGHNIEAVCHKPEY